MKMKVIRAVVVYNGEVYHEGDSVEVDNEKERQMMVRERCAVESKATTKSTEKTHYVPSGDAIEGILSPTAGETEGKVKGKRRGRR